MSVQDTKAGTDRAAPEVIAIIFRVEIVRIELLRSSLIVAKIDDVLDFDPSAVTDAMKSRVTLGDFVKL